MKRLFVASLVLAALLSPTFAADIPARMPTKAQPIVPIYDWTGFYLGVSLGARVADVDGTTISFGTPPGPPPFPALAHATYDSTTFRGGGYLGYNWQVSPRWLVGLEGDAAWGGSTSRVEFLQGVTPPPGAGDYSDVTQKWDAGIRGRIGYLVTPTWLLYLTGGVQWQGVAATANCAVNTCGGAAFNQTNSTTRTGAAIGAGLETRIFANWLGRAEYRYADFGTWHTSFGSPAVAIVKDFQVKTHTAFVGLAHKF